MKYRLKDIIKFIGPGFVTGASDDDPSGIGTYSQTGATFGFSQLWTSFFSFPLMTAVQEMCGRIGLVTGKGLAANIKLHYSKKILYFAILLLLVANIINIGADLGAMASAAQLLIGVPFPVLLVLVTLVTLCLEIFIPYKTYSKYLKYLTFSLLGYIIVALIIKPDWISIAINTLIPNISFNKEYLLNIIAILGTTISPYLFFWQTSEEVEEEIVEGKIQSDGKPTVTEKDLKHMRLDTVMGMLFSNIVMFFIILGTASTLNATGITEIKTASDAALALKPLVGDLSFLLFAAGIIGTGLLAVPVLAGSAAYAVAETLNINEGLGKKLNQAYGFYGIIFVATFIGLFINFLNIDPFQMLYYTAVVNGIIAPPLLVIILLIANNKKAMGEHTNKGWSNFFGILAAVIMSLCVLVLLVSSI